MNLLLGIVVHSELKVFVNLIQYLESCQADCPLVCPLCYNKVYSGKK